MKSKSHTQLNQVTNLIDYQLQRAATEGRITLQVPISINTIATKIVASLHKVYQAKHVEYNYHIDPNLRMSANEGDMYELLGNLLDNAYKYCQGQVMATITAGRSLFCDYLTVTLNGTLFSLTLLKIFK